MSREIVIKYELLLIKYEFNLQSKEISSNTVLRLAEQSIIYDSSPVRKWILNKILKCFDFTISFFRALFKRWVNNKYKLDESSLLHVFYSIL